MYVLLVLNFFTARCSSSQTKKTAASPTKLNNCKAQLEDGKIIDLSSLSKPKSPL